MVLFLCASATRYSPIILSLYRWRSTANSAFCYARGAALVPERAAHYTLSLAPRAPGSDRGTGVLLDALLPACCNIFLSICTSTIPICCCRCSSLYSRRYASIRGYWRFADWLSGSHRWFNARTLSLPPARASWRRKWRSHARAHRQSDGIESGGRKRRQKNWRAAALPRRCCAQKSSTLPPLRYTWRAYAAGAVATRLCPLVLLVRSGKDPRWTASAFYLRFNNGSGFTRRVRTDARRSMLAASAARILLRHKTPMRTGCSSPGALRTFCCHIRLPLRTLHSCTLLRSTRTCFAHCCCSARGGRERKRARRSMRVRCWTYLC